MSLFDAVRSGTLNEVLDLLDEGEDPNAVDSVGRTPLFDAAAAARNNMVVGMLLYHADPSIKSKAGKTAKESTTYETTQTLLDLWRGFPVDAGKKQSAISTLNDFLQKHAAIELPKIKPAVPEQVTEDRLCVDNSIVWAVRTGNLKEIKRLLKGRADPNTFDALGEPPIFSALRSGDAQLPALLLVHAADPWKKSRSGATPQDCTNSPVSKALLDLFQDKQITDSSRQTIVTALCHAPSDIQDCISKRLRCQLETKPEDVVTATDSAHQHRTSSREEIPSFNELLAAIDNDGPCLGNDAVVEDEVLDIDDDDPLMFAVRNGMLETVLKLIREGDADPNACDILGETPLFEAVSCGNLDIATALMHHSADPEYRSSSGSVPLDFASCEHMRLLIHLFISFRRRDVQTLPLLDKVNALCDRINNEEMRGLAMRQVQNLQALNLCATIERRCVQGSLVGLPSCDITGSSSSHVNLR
jgi:ankyrin repeat protein|mmetsp:Transcript_22812/g.36291  ORF Transcript_22812/g.36291 Transcript_22812/m.36291 type:complete len:473 (+) Transcript_22812:82-1500(+)